MKKVCVIGRKRWKLLDGVVKGFADIGLSSCAFGLQFWDEDCRDRNTGELDLASYDGIVLLKNEATLLAKVLSARRPTVVWEPHPKWAGRSLFMRVRARCVSISCDNRAVGRFAAEYLMSQQFENFAYVSEFAGSCWSVERGRAFERRLRDSGYGVAVFSPSGVRGIDHERKGLAEFIRKLPKPCALLACNDFRAAHLMSICEELGLLDEGQVFVLGVDDDPEICYSIRPAISSIRMSEVEAGREAARQLVALMDGRRKDSTDVVFGPVSVVERCAFRRKTFEDQRILMARTYIFENFRDPNLSCSAVADMCGLRQNELSRRFDRLVGERPHDFLEWLRMEEARRLLRTTDAEVQEIAGQSGFSSPGYFSRVFRCRFKMTPIEFRMQTDHKINERKK